MAEPTAHIYIHQSVEGDRESFDLTLQIESFQSRKDVSGTLYTLASLIDEGQCFSLSKTDLTIKLKFTQSEGLKLTWIDPPLD